MNRLVTKNRSVTVHVAADRLVFHTPLREPMILAKEQVTAVGQPSAFFLKWSWPLKRAIYIQHTATDLPQKLVFRSTDITAEDMLSILAEFAFAVKRG